MSAIFCRNRARAAPLCKFTLQIKRRANMGNVIELEAVTKRFGQGTTSVCALFDFTLALPWGGVHGILGENGAGKSTLFRLLLGLISADAGRVRIADCHPRSLDLIGVVSAMIDAPSFYPHLSAT